MGQLVNCCSADQDAENINIGTEQKPVLKLYWALPSPPSRAVKALLIAGNIKHEEKIVNIAKGENKTEEILKLNPAGTVPFMTINGKPYTESAAIMRYLAMTYPSLNKYYPDLTPENKAHIDIGLDFCGTTLRPVSQSTFIPIIFSRFANKEPSQKMLDEADAAEKTLRAEGSIYFFMNAGLGNWARHGPAQFGSNHTSIGDFLIYCQMQDIIFKGQEQEICQMYPNIGEWMGRMSQEKGLKDVHNTAEFKEVIQKVQDAYMSYGSV